MNRKYELTQETKVFDNHTLHRIRALTNIRWDVKAGDLGGWIESEENLGYDAGDTSWIFSGDVWGKSHVYDNSIVRDSIIHNSIMYNSQAYKSHTTNSIMRNSYVYNSILSNSAACDSSVCNASVYNYDIKKTADVISIAPIGSRDDRLTVIFSDQGPLFTTGCRINYPLAKFREMVIKTHGDSQYGKEYLATIDYIKKMAEIRHTEDVESQIKKKKEELNGKQES